MSFAVPDLRLDQIPDVAYQLLYCIIGLLFFLSSTGYLDCGIWRRLVTGLNPIQKEIAEKRAILAEHQAELNNIPMVDKFAAHMRKKRIVDKLKDEIKALEGQNTTGKIKASIYWALFGRSLSLFLAYYFARGSAGLTILSVPSAFAWPFNWLLAYPQSDAPLEEGKTDVSLFAFVILTVWSLNAIRKRHLNRKTTVKSTNVAATSEKKLF